ncbi:MAG: F0F1 ATP synthase subunit delta [Actinomycetota bacterium]|nr:F0F1 ATP synthase subunit delta [Actinomycetota bacterium]MDH4352763.1 F0F1 ATP synthase subunit delta [Actinomycetota bacterium]MDH5277983.1 F0F1 ATP synthase subunit delta [Actinomycetota bacterium]
MQGASRDSLAAARERLDALLAGGASNPIAAGEELFAVVDLLDGQAALRAALTDPSRDATDKSVLAADLLGGKLSDAVVEFVADTARSRWSAPRDLGDALEQLGVQAVLVSAEGAGRLDEVEDELFRFSRIVDSEPALRSTLTDRGIPADRKAALLGSLLDTRSSAEAAQLVTRVVTRPRGRQIEDALAAVGAAVARRRERLVATVTTAVPLTQEQSDRLAAALARQFGHVVHLNIVVDPAVIGGMRVALGDEIIDGTISTRLHEAARSLAR